MTVPSAPTHTGGILVLDFGGQTTQLIARRVRETHVFCDILPCTADAATLRARAPEGIIFSGSPASVHDSDAPRPDPSVYELGVPILGICYGHQVLADHFGGAVAPSQEREFGKAHLRQDGTSPLFAGIPPESTVWMSHGDRLTALPHGYVGIGRSENADLCAVSDAAGRVFGLQFHPEVTHTQHGAAMLENFAFRVCGCAPTWTPGSMIADAVTRVQAQVGDKGVLCGLSGGVDSAVTAALLHRAIGDQLRCVFVDTGLLRQGECDTVETVFREAFHIQLEVVDAADRFLDKLAPVQDPEQKRKVIGREFIRVFEEAAADLGRFEFLAQGTLYPDVIESMSVRGPSAVIKSHHNVGGLPEDMEFELVEPLREMFKDEVRAVGAELGLPEHLVWRHPFPGPGLAVRCLGPITKERLATLRQADAIAMEEIVEAGLYRDIWQALVVLLPVKTVGVMGDDRTYEEVAVLRCVTSHDGMTADWFPMPPDVLGRISNRVINEVRGINRVVYDVSSKPPATIEWE